MKIINVPPITHEEAANYILKELNISSVTKPCLNNILEIIREVEINGMWKGVSNHEKWIAELNPRCLQEKPKN